MIYVVEYLFDTLSSRRRKEKANTYLSVLRYCLLILWTILASTTLSRSQTHTGTICSVDLIMDRITPILQLVLVVVDSCIICYAARVQNTCQSNHWLPEDLTNSFWGAFVGCIAWLVILLANGAVGSAIQLFLNHSVLQSLATDALLLSIAILCSLKLLANDEPVTAALRISLFIWLGSLISNVITEPVLPPLIPSEIAKFAALTIMATLAVDVQQYLHLEDGSYSQILRSIRRVMLPHLFLFSAILVWYGSLTGRSTTSVAIAIDTLHTEAAEAGRVWAAGAALSKTLGDATTEYRKRYGLPPPPNFDKWYEFATARDSVVIDNFDQIFDELLPFWGIAPSEIRSRTVHVIMQKEKNIGGIQIVNGTVRQSPDIPGTHRWMTDALERMIEPFAKWLPDMFVAFNLADECRVSVPFQDITKLQKRGNSSISRLASYYDRGEFVTSPRLSAPWPDSFDTINSPAQGHMTQLSKLPVFEKNPQHQIYHEWVASTCPPESQGRQSRWTDWGKVCPRCIAPHSLMTNHGPIPKGGKTLANTCHQPDIANQYGFFMSPYYMEGTRTLFPIFSQAKVHGYADILIPSPWDFADKSTYEDASDMSWADKSNSLYWRGSSSDGFAKHRLSEAFLRARFVHESFQNAKAMCKRDERRCDSINVSFVGDISKCDEDDCSMEKKSFHRWGQMTQPLQYNTGGSPGTDMRLPGAEPFEANWRYRHLMDMDGAGFSGRFLPFLRSHSLVYRAALFRAWFDDRLVAWKHYVPADPRLGAGFWNTFWYLSGISYFGDNDAQKQTGPMVAQTIAAEGRSWATKAVRAEDMQIYTFRLLLEWGRIINDDREHMWYM